MINCLICRDDLIVVEAKLLAIDSLVKHHYTDGDILSNIPMMRSEEYGTDEHGRAVATTGRIFHCKL